MLHRLPLDVLVRILSCLNPLGILNLRQVCASLLTASYQRILWIQALRDMCFERNIFPSSFPVSEMTLSQLQDATNACPRFIRRMRREFSSGTPNLNPLAPVIPAPLHPFSTRILSSYDSAAEDFKHMVLVPGGRFLFTTSGSNVRLWDLGFHSAAFIKPFPLSSTNIGSDPISRIAVTQSSTASDEIFVLVIFQEPLICGNLSVFRICPTLKQPSFIHIACASVGNYVPRLMLFSGTHVVVGNLDLEQVLLWNFLQDTWVLLSGPTMVDACKISICKDTLLILASDEGYGEIKLTNLPSFHPRQPDEKPPIENTRALLRVSTDANSNSCCNDSPSFNSLDIAAGLMHFDICQEPMDTDTWTLSHYILKPIENDRKEGLPGCLPVLIGETTLNDMEMTNSSCIHWLADGIVQFSWISGDVVETHISTFSPDSDVPVQQFSGVLSEGYGVTSGDFVLCPFSGRLCLRTKAGAGHEIRVVDYLAPTL
ncbi:hypothetical protein C8J57DRAFT_1714242 [Mycena rebaudengoi]|nr:hypothetical protein C8J57DRAFT_1714242 [Mycena rebaudengoi]